MRVTTINEVYDVIFHNEAAEAAQGAVIENQGYSYLTIEITGTDVSTSTVKFWGSLASETLASMLALSGLKLSDYSTRADNTTGINELWLLDVRGIKYLSMELDAITGTGAKITVKGRLTT